ncbi:chloroplastic group IIA intron splicing facilitator CRS1, chloroplastic isoform X2 [Euphorbia lathyris]|uniref:chloroplastic group IIA intron splicing facilitator CRS1, chloroplastic isoform X2 n=1 Tax=Euphorbia lathyris TaxID=212925 RepID=UPI0033132BE9
MPASLSLQFFTRTPIISSLNPSTHKNSSTNVHSPSLPTTNNLQFPVLSNPISQSNAAIKVPTPPWMRGPLLLQPHEVLNLSKPRNKNSSKTADFEKTDKALTDKESGVRGKKAMIKIVKHIEALQENEDSLNTSENSEEFDIGESLGQLGGDGDQSFSKKLPWEKEEKFVYQKIKKEKVITKTELSLDRELLERLRTEAARMKNWVKVKKAGVTQGVVDEIRCVWRRNELAMVKFDVPLCRNMNRAREIVELKTGGLVVWRRKDSLVIYRGSNYHLTKSCYPRSGNYPTLVKDGELEFTSTIICTSDDATTPNINGSLFERETDRLLNGLGPRFVDWWMGKPLPVDADLLPEVIPGFMPPSRLCPSYSRPKLKDEELTYLRKVAYALPTHFVLGRNRKLQGLAAAILKLWQRSIIAKIAVKWGIPNTNNEEMANELKYLTGGVLLLRDKFYIILYRGKDFIPGKVAHLIVERETELKRCLVNEEDARLNAIETFYIADEPSADTCKIGTLDEFQDMEVKFGEPVKGNEESKLQLGAEKEKLEKELRNQENRLFIQEKKIEKSARELSKLNSSYVPAEMDTDLEIITEEERECFRKMGMKMHSYLVLDTQANLLPPRMVDGIQKLDFSKVGF